MGASPRQATRISDESPSKRPGVIGFDQASDLRCANDKGGAGRNQGDLLEGATSSAQALLQTGGGRQGPEKDHHRSRARAARLHLGHRDQGGSCSQAADSGLTKSKNKGKSKNFPKNERTKTNRRMNNATQFEHRASSSRSMHVGESSAHLCDRLSRTRDVSQRQLPTDHDYAVPTREYQTDQSSLKPAPTAARSVLDKRQMQRQRQKQPHKFAGVDRVTPYQLASEGACS